MTETKGDWLKIGVGHDEMDGYRVGPDTPGTYPGIVLLQEIFGVNHAIREAASKFAAEGYIVLVPDLFWRQERRVDLDYGEAGRTKGFSLMQGYDFASGPGDIASAVSFLRENDNCTGSVSIVGFCLGGKLAVMGGAVSDPASIISFYGVQLDKNLAEIDRIGCPLQIHVGDADEHVPAETVDILKQHLDGRRNAEVFVYPGAQHAFFNAARDDVFDSESSEAAFERATSLLAEVSA